MIVLEYVGNAFSLVLLLMGSYMVAFFSLMAIRHGWSWAWHQMFTRPWRAALLRSEVQRAFKEGMNKAPIPFPEEPNPLASRDEIEMYEGIYVFPEEDLKSPPVIPTLEELRQKGQFPPVKDEFLEGGDDGVSEPPRNP